MTTPSPPSLPSLIRPVDENFITPYSTHLKGLNSALTTHTGRMRDTIAGLLRHQGITKEIVILGQPRADILPREDDHLAPEQAAHWQGMAIPMRYAETGKDGSYFSAPFDLALYAMGLSLIHAIAQGTIPEDEIRARVETFHVCHAARLHIGNMNLTFAPAMQGVSLQDFATTRGIYADRIAQ